MDGLHPCAVWNVVKRIDKNDPAPLEITNNPRVMDYFMIDVNRSVGFFDDFVEDVNRTVHARAKTSWLG